jgi:hypothetical protein
MPQNSLALTRSIFAATLLASGLALGPLGAQDPSPPPGGFTVQWQRDVLITWSDSYRSRIDFAYPQQSAPQGGWPGVLVVHGGGRSRKVPWAQETMRRLAEAGFVAFGYDVRGQGDCPGLNPALGQDRGTIARRIADMADCFHVLAQQQSSLLDSSRLGIYGQSQGGGHALRGAAYSGRALPRAGFTATMPTILAAVSDIQIFDIIEDFTPGNTLFRADLMGAAFAEGGLNHPVIQAFTSDDINAAQQFFINDPGRIYLSELQQSDVPIFVMNSWDDSNHLVNLNADSFLTLKPGVPRRHFLTTGGHASASNDIEDLLNYESIVRWMERFLKGVPNGIDQEPFAEVAVIPHAPKDYQDPKTEWIHRSADVWPPQSPGTTFYLRGNARLRQSAPSSAESAVPVRNRVAPGYGPQQFAQDGGKLGKTLPQIPLQRSTFDTAPLTQDMELFGRPVVEMDVTSSTAQFQVTASLLAVDAQDRERFISTGVIGVRGNSTARQRIRIELADIAYILPAGYKLRLSLQNLHVRQQPGNEHLFAAPFFYDFDVTPQIDTSFPARLELPVRAPELSITPRIAELSASAAIQHTLSVRGGAARAGDIYLVLVGGSGITPGLPTLPHIPLNFDAWTQLGFALQNTPVFDRFAGLLDTQGRARAQLQIPNTSSPLLLGTRLSFSALGLQQNGFETSWTSTLRVTR